MKGGWQEALGRTRLACSRILLNCFTVRIFLGIRSVSMQQLARSILDHCFPRMNLQEAVEACLRRAETTLCDEATLMRTRCSSTSQ